MFVGFIVLGTIASIIWGARHEEEFMTNWNECDGNCKSCKDKEICMNRPYEGE